MAAPVAAESIGRGSHHPPLPPPLPLRSEDQVAASRLLRRYPNLGLRRLKQFHAHLFRRHLHHDNILAAKLVASCASSGAMSYASRLFLSLPDPDLVLCNSMLRGYTLNSLPCAALAFFLDLVLSRGFCPDRFTYPYVLKACASLSDGALGAQLHGSIAKKHDLCGDPFVLNSLLDMYFKCRMGERARRVFGRIQSPDATAWNTVVSGLLAAGDLEGAMEVFDGMPVRDVISWNTLLSAHARAGKMDFAQRLFDEMPERNLVSWNALIAGYAQNGQNNMALAVFSQMLSSGVQPDSTTIISVASACDSARTPDDIVVNQIAGFARMMNSVSVSTALLSLYCKVGRIEEAREIFDGIPEKDLVAWNAMIGGYSQNHRPAEAIELFRLMQKHKHVKPDGMTMASLIDSCSQIGALELGEWIHAYIQKNKINMDTFLATALVDMYAKCGDLDRSRHLFLMMPEKDLASWNAMIKGLAVHGQGDEALEVLEVMEKNGIAPNDITFVGLLSACSHGGLVDKGLELFNAMQEKYAIAPRIEHYGCVVDILSRAGRLAEAYEFVEGMPIKPDSVVWGSLLSASRSLKNVELAEEAASKLMELEPGHDGNYILLSNVYASVGKWAQVEEIRARMRTCRVIKEPGCSSVELDGTIHEFTAGDRSHPKSGEIYAAWDELVKLLKPMGYEPDISALLKNVSEGDKEEALYRHSEKLALSFALISSTSKSPVRIVKNLRICTDCHRAMELVSKLKERDIIVRDRNRFHHFRAGSCSCGGHW